MTISACGASHRGNLRGHNEDNIYVDGIFRKDISKDNILIHSKREGSPHVYAVFDGLGGEAVLGVVRHALPELREVPHSEIVVGPNRVQKFRGF